jgi:hypothetical protein
MTVQESRSALALRMPLHSQGRMTTGPGAVRNSLIRRNAFIERVAALSEAGSTLVWSSAWTA